ELGITAKQIAEATGKKNMVSHWFGASQWQLPNEADYRKLQALFSRIAAEKFQEQQLEQPHHQLVASYDSLNRKYSELLDEFKSLRRYFSVSVSVPYTDVWMHKPVQFYPGKHPCEKPADMLRQIINASSRPGDLVADFFMGSGSTIKAAMALGRRALGVELETERFNQTIQEISMLSANTIL
ncbi:site-specific DNA-methyltransferase, partial [Escherichia coli]